MKGEFPDKDQRVAVCLNAWRQKNARDDFASHRVTRNNGKIVIHALELFVGFDPSIDDEDDEKMRKYDADKIAQVVARTQAYMGKGQNPKLILGHNPDDDDGTVRPTIGDIVSVVAQEINGIPGIVGDVEMSADVFATTIGTNSFPRRSSEIWSDGYLSEVALLGSQTPARPIPDTKFMRDGLTLESFARHLPVVQFAEGAAMLDPGPTNVSIPRSSTMADHKDDDMDQLKAKLKAAEDERDELKNKLSRFAEHDDENDDKDKDKNARQTTVKGKAAMRTMEIERDDFSRQLEEQKRLTIDLRQNFLAERFNSKLEQMQMQGYRLGDASMKAALLRKIIAAGEGEDDVAAAQAACDADLEFRKQYMSKDPTGLRIDQSQARTGLPGDQQEKYDRDKSAGERARDRCVMEGTSDPATYQVYLKEELQKTG